MTYIVRLGCFGEAEVADAAEALEFIHRYYPEGVIFSMADVDDPAIGESPIYETADERDTFSIGTVYPVKHVNYIKMVIVE